MPMRQRCAHVPPLCISAPSCTPRAPNRLCDLTPSAWIFRSQFLNAQVQQIIEDPLAPGLASASEATLIFGTTKFRHSGGAHGRSSAAQVTLQTLEGSQLVVQLDASGLSLLNGSSLSNHRYVDVCDLLADHSPAYVAAFREINGVDPVVQWRRPASAGRSSSRSFGGLAAEFDQGGGLQQRRRALSLSGRRGPSLTSVSLRGSLGSLGGFGSSGASLVPGSHREGGHAPGSCARPTPPAQGPQAPSLQQYQENQYQVYQTQRGGHRYENSQAFEQAAPAFDVSCWREAL